MLIPKFYPLSCSLIAAATLSLTLGTPNSAHAENYYGAWVQEFDTSSVESQFSKAVAMDRHGNVLVTGRALVGGEDRMYTAKYDALDGHLVWQKFEGTGSVKCIGTSIVADSEGNVIVTGTRNNQNIDYYTVKYNGVSGAPMWGPVSYDGTAGGGEDTPVKVVVDHNDDVIVTGRSAGSGSYIDIVTIKYLKLTGVQTGLTDRFTTAGTLEDYPSSLAVDSNNNIIVAGTAATGGGKRLYVRKLTSGLAKDWDFIQTSTGDFDGAKSVAVDSNNDIVATGPFVDAGNHHGLYTVKLNSNGTVAWTTPAVNAVNNPPVGTEEFHEGGATSVAIGPDNNPIVTGWVTQAGGTDVIRTIKYRSAGSNGAAFVLWDKADTGLAFGSSRSRQVITDGSSNAIIVGETENPPNDTDIYFAKYDATTGDRVFAGTYDGSFNYTDEGVGVATDSLANIAVLGCPTRKVNGTGLRSYLTIKLNRFIALTGDALPNEIPGVDDDAEFVTGGTPAISNNSSVVASVSFKNGRKKQKAILHEGGSTLLPAVQGEAAPVKPGEDAVDWVSFSDPVIAPDGDYAFAAKVTGKQSTGVWSNITGNLLPALRKGGAVTGLSPAGDITSILSYSIESNSLLAVVKVSGVGSMNTVLVRVDSGNNVVPLLRTGKNGIDIGGTDFTVSKFSILTPTKLSPTDGRWDTSSGVIVKASVFATDDKKDKREVLLRITNAASKAVIVSSDSAAAGVEPTATYKSFGLPSIGTGNSQFAFAATLNKLKDTVSGSNDTVLIYTAAGVAFKEFAREGEATGVTGIEATASYSGFSDPIINDNADVAFIGTLKGKDVGAKKSVLVFGDPMGTLQKVARVGETAPAPPPQEGEEAEAETFYSGFTSFGLAGGANGKPVYLAKLKGAASGKNNVALFGVDSSGAVRRLLRTGDFLGSKTLKSMTIMKATPSAIAAARSVSSAGVVVLSVAFTDRTTALMAIGIP